MKFSDFLTYFTDTIFRRDVNEWHNPVVRWLVQQYRLLFYTARGLLEHGTIVRSAALTFYTLMSLVPILAVVFAVVKGFGLADGLIENLYGLFPRNPDIVDYIVNFAENALARTQGGVVAAVALVMLFWAVIRVFGSIESAFNNIWEVKVERSITRQWTDYIAVVMIVPILWIVANAVGNYAEQLLGFDDSWYFNLLSHLASMIVIWVMFTFLYIVIPNARVRFGSALMAGIVAGTDAGKAGFLTALYVVLVPLFGLFFKRKVSLPVWVAVALSVVSLYLLCIKGSFRLAAGDLLVLVCAVCFAVHILVIDRFSATCDGVKLSCVQFLFAALWSGVCIPFFEHVDAAALLSCALPLLYVGVFSCGVGYTLQILAQKGSNPTVVTILLSLESVFAVIAGAIILHQSMTPREYLGCVLMFLAVVLAQIPLPAKAARAESK